MHIRAWLWWFTTHPYFERTVVVLIGLNAITLGLETLPGVMAQWGDLLLTIDFAFIVFFTAEIVFRITAQGWRFFKNGWNIFDFAIVAITLMPFVGNLSVLRAFRILRALRILSVILHSARCSMAFLRHFRDSCQYLQFLHSSSTLPRCSR